MAGAGGSEACSAAARNAEVQAAPPRGIMSVVVPGHLNMQEPAVRQIPNAFDTRLVQGAKIAQGVGPAHQILQEQVCVDGSTSPPGTTNSSIFQSFT